MQFTSTLTKWEIYLGNYFDSNPSSLEIIYVCSQRVPKRTDIKLFPRATCFVFFFSWTQKKIVIESNWQICLYAYKYNQNDCYHHKKKKRNKEKKSNETTLHCKTGSHLHSSTIKPRWSLIRLSRPSSHPDPRRPIHGPQMQLINCVLIEHDDNYAVFECAPRNSNQTILNVAQISKKPIRSTAKTLSAQNPGIKFSN